jgi:hypothetical protein
MRSPEKPFCRGILDTMKTGGHRHLLVMNGENPSAKRMAYSRARPPAQGISEYQRLQKNSAHPVMYIYARLD